MNWRSCNESSESCDALEFAPIGWDKPYGVIAGIIQLMAMIRMGCGTGLSMEEGIILWGQRRLP